MISINLETDGPSELPVKINLNGCAISVINAITSFFGVSMIDYIIGLIGPEIENQLEAEIPNFETSIDIHNEFDFFIAEKALEYLKEHNPEEVKIFL